MSLTEMKHKHTFKLYYNTYLWKVKLILPCVKSKSKKSIYKNEEEVLTPIIDWISDNIIGNYRFLRSRRVTQPCNQNIKNSKTEIKQLTFYHFTVFLDNEIDYLNLINNFKQFVDSTYSPANKSHEELIRGGNILDIRNKLYYGIYRYKISFWNSKFINQSTFVSKELLANNIKTYLHNELKDNDNQEYHIIEFNNTIYLKTKNDFTMIKLSLGEYIKKITIVVLPNEMISISTL